jgi:hypothetical protein
MHHTFRLGRLVPTVIVSAGLATAVACKSASSSSGPIDVPLMYHPTGSSSDNGMVPPKAKIFVAAVIDKRPQMMPAGPATTMPAAAGPIAIGHTTQGSSPNEVVYDTGVSPADFVHDAFVDQLQKSGATVVLTQAEADRTVTLSLTEFDVTEEGLYKGTVQASVVVADKDGREIFHGVESGENSTFGKSVNPEDYQQVLTAAAANMAQSMTHNSAFVQALTIMQ